MRTALTLLGLAWAFAAVASTTATGQAPPAATPNDVVIEMAARSLREGSPDEALALIREAAPKHPEWSPPRVILARLYFAIGQPIPGRRALEAAAVEVPESPDLYISFASLAINEGRWTDAQLHCEKALELADKLPDDSPIAKTGRREAQAGLATVAENRQDWEAARRSLTAWLAIDPKNGVARQRLGRALFFLGQTEEALREVTTAAADDPNIDSPAVTMAFLSSQKGEMAKAVEWFESALKAEPKNPKPRIAYARWRIERGEPAQARALVDQAAAIDPKLPEIERLRALIAWQERDLPTAERLFEDLQKKAPNDPAILNLLALSLVEQDDAVKRARGLQFAEMNVRQNPASVENLAALGRAYYRSGRLDEADRMLRAALNNSGGQVSGDTAFFLARLLADGGRIDDAKRLLSSALALPNAFAYRGEAKALLEALDREPRSNPSPTPAKSATATPAKSAVPKRKGER